MFTTTPPTGCLVSYLVVALVLVFLQGCLLRGGASRGEEDSEAGGHQVHPQEGAGRQREQHRKRDRCPAQVCRPNLHSKHAFAQVYVITPHNHPQHMLTQEGEFNTLLKNGPKLMPGHFLVSFLTVPYSFLVERVLSTITIMMPGGLKCLLLKPLEL